MTEQPHPDSAPDELKFVLNWQQSRYHQLQSLSQSLLSALLAVGAIVATVVAAFKPSFSWWFSNKGSFAAHASTSIFTESGLMGIHDVAWALFYLYILLGVVMVFYTLLKLYSVITGPPLFPRFGAQTQANEEGSGTIGSYNLAESTIDKNQDIIKDAQEKFDGAVVRVIVVAFSWFLAWEIHRGIVNPNPVILAGIILVLFIPNRVWRYFIKKVLAVTPPEQDELMSVEQIFTTSEGGRFPDSLARGEKLVIVPIYLFSILGGVIIVGSALNGLV